MNYKKENLSTFDSNNILTKQNQESFIFNYYHNDNSTLFLNEIKSNKNGDFNSFVFNPNLSFYFYSNINNNISTPERFTTRHNFFLPEKKLGNF